MAEGMVHVREVQPVGMATVIARKGREGDLAAALGAAAGPGFAVRDGLELIGTGPGVWLAIGETAGLAERLAGVASVADQSGGYALLELSGAGARELLQRGAFIDLHPGVFAAGASAVTMIAHMGAILWCIEDERFGVAVFRSFAGSFRAWMEHVAAGMGVSAEFG